MMGILLGTFVAPGFYALSAFVGAGSMFAGIAASVESLTLAQMHGTADRARGLKCCMTCLP